jgi:hypothetical protein
MASAKVRGIVHPRYPAKALDRHHSLFEAGIGLERLQSSGLIELAFLARRWRMLIVLLPPKNT